MEPFHCTPEYLTTLTVSVLTEVLKLWYWLLETDFFLMEKILLSIEPSGTVRAVILVLQVLIQESSKVQAEV